MITAYSAKNVIRYFVTLLKEEARSLIILMIVMEASHGDLS